MKLTKNTNYVSPFFNLNITSGSTTSTACIIHSFKVDLRELKVDLRELQALSLPTASAIQQASSVLADNNYMRRLSAPSTAESRATSDLLNMILEEKKAACNLSAINLHRRYLHPQSKRVKVPDANTQKRPGQR